jgi:hypothetical protein
MFPDTISQAAANPYIKLMELAQHVYIAEIPYPTFHVAIKLSYSVGKRQRTFLSGYLFQLACKRLYSLTLPAI